MGKETKVRHVTLNIGTVNAWISLVPDHSLLLGTAEDQPSSEQPESSSVDLQAVAGSQRSRREGMNLERSTRMRSCGRFPLANGCSTSLERLDAGRRWPAQDLD